MADRAWRPVLDPRMTQLSPAPSSLLDDFRLAFGRPRLLAYLAKRDITRQYDRTVLGPAWIPINVFVHVALLGFIFSMIFEGQKYIPHFAIGYAVWTTFGRAVGEGARLWIANRNYLQHLCVPLSTFLVKHLIKMTYVLALSLPVGALASLIFGLRPTLAWLLVIPGAVVYLANLSWIIALLSVLGVRFRDLTQFIPNLLFMGYLATPIIWETSRLGEHQWVARVNPIYHLIELMRAPLLNELPTALTWIVGVSMAVAGHAVALPLLALCRRRIVLWL